MSVIATIAVSADDFTLGAALSPNPGVRVRLVRVVPMGGAFAPYLWMSNESVDDIADALRGEDDVESFDVVDTVDGESLVRVQWAEEADGFLETLAETDASILDGEGAEGVWRFRLRFDDHDDLTDFYRRCAEHDLDLDLETVHNPGAPREFGTDVNLTDAQRETLELALNRGYFDVPRRTNMVELADELGISDSAVSQRLRRGTAKLLEVVLEEGTE